MKVFAARKVARLGVPATELDQLQQLVDGIGPITRSLGRLRREFAQRRADGPLHAAGP